MLSDYTLPYTTLVPKVYVEVSQNDRGFVTCNPSQDITSLHH